MFTTSEWLGYIIAGFLWWLAVYLLSRNVFSKLSWTLFWFLFSFSVYAVVSAIFPHINNLDVSQKIVKLTTWSYILPKALLLHLSILVTQRSKEIFNRVSLLVIYASVFVFIALSITTNLVIDYRHISNYIPEIGYFNARGPLFVVLGLTSPISAAISFWNYATKFKHISQRDPDIDNKWKFLLPAASALFYMITGPTLVLLYLYARPETAISLTAPLLILPFLPILVAVFWFRLISDIEALFNWREFTYLALAIGLIFALNAFLFFRFAPLLGEAAYYFVAIFSYITIFTHGFYDWLTTFVRDLFNNAGRGFSLITDADILEVIRNYHRPEKLEINPLLKFKAVHKIAKGGKLVDAAQDLMKEAIAYFKEDDFPRRTKQNLKYQLLKMVAIDQAEEGQVLWELGFEGYPFRIMASEDRSRPPLFKVEAASDYTATSRNAFIALKKEATHDLAWRLSYLEKLARKAH